MTNRRIVRHALFTYTAAEDGLERTALRGATVELTDDELQRAERLEAVAAEDDPEVTATSPVQEPLTPDEVLGAAAQGVDAGSAEPVTAEDTAAGKTPARRTRSSG